MYFFIFWYNVLSVSIYQRLLTTYWLNLHKEYWFPMLLFCDISRVEHNQMIWDFSVLKSICVSFINIIIFENHLLIFCILNFCFVLSFVFVSCFIFVFILLFLSLFFLLFFYLFLFFFFNIYIYWFFSLSDIFSCVFEHVPLLLRTILPLYDMLVTNLSLAQALEQQ
jgi:hypothetical protein